MKILYTELYKAQLANILEVVANIDFQSAKRFKTYLDTIIINIPTKFEKYKESTYFNDKNIKEVEHENCIIFFYPEKETNTFLILGIIQKQ